MGNREQLFFWLFRYRLIAYLKQAAIFSVKKWPDFELYVGIDITYELYIPFLVRIFKEIFH